MISFSKYKVILWDFDGVLMDSMGVRELGFADVLSEYPRDQVQRLLIYHRQNGGLSRYVKFRHFFEEIRSEQISDQEINTLAERFSEIMRTRLTNRKLLIAESTGFIANYCHRYQMHVVSGSDEKELQYLCSQLGLSQHFLSIHGSPTPKRDLISMLLKKFNYDRADVVFIGDSINDLEASEANGIDFLGFNNAELDQLGTGFISRFDQIFH